jgi:hypothetical protein
VDQEAVSDVDATALENEATGAGRPDFPATVPVMTLPRRDRAEVFRALDPIQRGLRDSTKATPGFLSKADDLDRIQAIIDGILVRIAVDPEVMRAWADNASDGQVLQALVWAMRDLGEANGSTGS